MKTLLAPETKPQTELPVYVIDGSEIRTWTEAVACINALVPQADWQGRSLDALDDIFQGGYGMPNKYIVIWKSSDVSRQALGLEATRLFYENLPDFQHLYEAGNLKTLFETVVGSFEGNADIELRLE